MTLKKRLGATLATLLLGFGGVVAAATPAEAAYTDCFSGKFCLWDSIEYSGALYMYSSSTSCYSLGVQNNTASAGYNRTSRSVRMYDGTGCTGEYYTWYSGERWTDFRLVCGTCFNWNDKPSSFKYV